MMTITYSDNIFLIRHAMLSHPHYFSLQLELHLILGMLNLKKNGNILNLKLKNIY